MDYTKSIAMRLPLVEALRAIASTIIALHHLALYWPPASEVIPGFSTAVEWMKVNGRATQLFFVIGGFVMAQSMSKRHWDYRAFRRYMGHRYLRLALPYLAAMVLAIGACALGRGLVSDYVVGAPPTLMQVVAHVFFLQKILGFDSFSAGMWFVCINFQMSLILALLLLLRDASRVPSIVLPMMLAWGLAAASLFHFNLDDRWDMWAVYFFAHFFTGVMAYYGSKSARWQRLFWLYVLMTMLALTWRCWRADWTLEMPIIRMLVALGVGILLFCGGKLGFARTWPRSAVLSYLGRTSYSLFLVHFPVLVLVLTLWTRLTWTSPLATVAGLCVTYLLSLLASNLFYRFVEVPAAKRIDALA